MKTILLVLALTVTASAAPVRPCAMNQISLALDGENGNFNGMSQGGTLLVLRNISPTACSVPGFPVLTFRDEQKAILPISRQVPPGMHPGPVIVPAIVASGAEVTSTLHWVAGDVYDHGTCLKPASLSLSLAGDEQTIAFGQQICGPTTKVTYSATRLNPDPVYTPKP